MLTRRDGLRAGLAGLGIVLAPTAIWAEIGDAAQAADPLLDRVCDLVIPATDTDGALKTRVPEFVMFALAHADGETMDGSEWRTVSAALVGKGFGKGAQDLKILEAFDQAAFADKPDKAGLAWRKIKSVIVTGYYTSEVGGSKELRYDLAPGHFDADQTLAQATPELSNDWIAVNFR